MLVWLGAPLPAIPQDSTDTGPFAPTASSVDELLAQQDDFGRFLAEQEQLFEDYRAEITAEYDAWVRADSLAFESFRREIEAKWGTFEGSTDKDWVEYSNDRDTRTVVDFERGEARVEVLLTPEEAAGDPQAALDRLESAVQDLVVDRGTTLDYEVLDEKPEPLGPEPVLAQQLATAEDEPVTAANAADFSRQVVKAEAIERVPVRSEGGGQRVRATVVVPLVPNHLKVRAKRYVPKVREMSVKYHLDPRLVFAIIHTESFFNPKARSHVPAFGLMQLVPSSGGRDAYRHIHGEDRVVTANYLYDPDRNIEMGCAYLDVLMSRYLDGIDNVDSRYYCAISAYNTGVGNVNRTFTGGTRTEPAIRRINRMSSEDVLETLKTDLPHQETRDYIARVLDRMKYYEEWGA
jgi:membrane-bound lytic murein transglycosylase C